MAEFEIDALQAFEVADLEFVYHGLGLVVQFIFRAEPQFLPESS